MILYIQQKNTSFTPGVGVILGRTVGFLIVVAIQNEGSRTVALSYQECLYYRCCLLYRELDSLFVNGFGTIRKNFPPILKSHKNDIFVHKIMSNLERKE